MVFEEEPGKLLVDLVQNVLPLTRLIGGLRRGEARL
jgi:hypothetical protein